MATMIFAFVFLMIVIVAMSVGVIMGRKPISGSCGGLANVGIEGKCSICGDDPQKCEEEQERQQKEVDKADLGYEIKGSEKE
ncbi:(Na+)-NQR maturation NqrM [Neptuniibacter sp.]|uniref:(Na+)-NQR maturation NqrM n=1 Tax=Neptuniibacter sp. TaxID=1962643 RepID=UPI002624D867|nr:(Na+)-NQR maturation NqrM [Neptuniibacter sp.]MCP4596312.1 (Na+)-NQR maturation NqrM [Neptuniibacter sp.]